jgi:hypothetical protein
MCLSGVFVAIELKTNEGKLDKLQEYKLKAIAQSGGISMVISPGNFDESFEFLSDITDKVEKTFTNKTH